MSQPLISVIIPTYEHASTISACLESVFSQTYPSIEVIVVNDGSTDNTEHVLRPYLNRITLITQENRGSNPARNRGFTASKGELVIFCDADVIMRQDMLEELVRALGHHPQAGYAYSAFRFGWKRFSSYPFDAKRLRQMNYIHTTALIRRADFPGFDESLKRFQDWDVWLSILERGKEGVYVPQELFQVVDAHGRVGISQWRPSMLYKLPWKLFHWTPASVRKYGDARRIVLTKHGLK